MSKTKPQKFSKKDLEILGKDFNYEKTTSSQLESLLIKYKENLATLTSQGNYSEAGKCSQKVDLLKKLLKQKKLVEVKNRHNQEKINLTQDRASDIDEMNTQWEQKFQDLQKRSKKAVDELKSQHEKELQDLYNRFQKKAKSNVKPSLTYLQLQKEEEGLVKLKQFDEAEIVKKKREKQGQQDFLKNNKDLEKSLKLEEKKLKAKQNNSLLYLQKGFQRELDELNRAKNKEMECLDRKYIAKNNELTKQQKYENMYNFNDSYARRGGDSKTLIHEPKFPVRSKIKGPKSMELEKIFGEVKDNKSKTLDVRKIGVIDNINVNNSNNIDHVNQEEIDLTQNDEDEIINKANNDVNGEENYEENFEEEQEGDYA